MNSLLVAAFEREVQARRTMRWLDDAAFSGQIDLYQRSLMRRRPDGTFKVF